MYKDFYGLKEKPFNLNPDPSYIFWSKGHEHAYTHLEYAISENKGFGIITGEVGSGKTTLLYYLLHKIPQNLQVALINQTDVNFTQFLRLLCNEFDIKVTKNEKTILLQQLQEFLIETFAAGRRAILIIDEAQNLPDKTIEELRMLSNLEMEKEHLIQIILVGQPELKDKLRRRHLRQFTQRVTVHAHLVGMSSEDVSHYVRHRLKIAGATNQDIFTAEALASLHRHTQGIPRLINILCDMAMVFGYADEKQIIDREIIDEVLKNRQDGGILIDGQQEEENEIDKDEEKTDTRDITISKMVKKQLLRLERQLLVQQQMIVALENQINDHSQRHDTRDELVIELLKLLKSNLESRGKAEIRYRQLLDRVAELETKAAHGKTPKTSFFSRLQKK
ncbi:MAG: hypothetical protein BZ151_10240 [Desulfobacca sp. 4484_104]|nr:MAG: hypothetical protein BZ151_10240 [Desulfobacca sp. 4484_104]